MKLSSALTLLPALLGAALISSCASPARVDPAAHAVLLQTTEKLRAAQTVEVTGTRIADPSLLPAGSTRESVKFDLAVARPDTIAVKSSDGEGSRHLLAGNGQITLYDEKANAYSTDSTSEDSIDGLVDEIEDKFDTRLALGEMLGEDPMATLMDGVTSVKSAGEEQIGGTVCTRLDFTQDDLNWQLWIATSDALPRQISMTFTKKPGQPKRVVTIKQWKLNGKIPAGLFTCNPKPGAQEVDVIH